jgi:mono/diheme cytochrome c family protein
MRTGAVVLVLTSFWACSGGHAPPAAGEAASQSGMPPHASEATIERGAAGAQAAAGGTGASASQIARGVQVFREQKCQSCHSIAGEGSTRYPLDGVGAKLKVEDVRKWIVTPREMDPKVRKPSYEKLPKEEVDALVAYLMTLK